MVITDILQGVSTYNYVLGGSLAPGKGLGNLGNNALTWEETKQLDLGVDIGFLNDRIYLMYDYYNKKVDGLLYQVDIPRASGFSNIYSNTGDYKHGDMKSLCNLVILSVISNGLPT